MMKHPSSSSGSACGYGAYGYDQIGDHHHHHDQAINPTVGDEEQVRKGPWTEEEDSLLVNYVTAHGEGHWNTLARNAGLRRTGKSCRLRWLNYLRPDVRRGNISLQEQLLILQLHSRWGNRWSKIAQELPGRTDNEIKNYWRTRVQKQAKQLKCDVNSQQFRDTMKYVWMPRLAERIQAASSAPNSAANNNASQTAPNEPDTSSWDTQVSDLTESYNNNNPEQVPRTEPCPGNNYYWQAESESLEDMLSWQEMTSAGSLSLDNTVWSDENVWFLQQQLYDD